MNTLFGLLAGSTLAFSQLGLATETYQIDPDHTTVAFSVNHLGFSNISGRFSDFQGQISLDQDNISASTVALNINTTSLTTAHSKRDEHLGSKDFFNSSMFNQITFSSTKITESGEKSVTMIGDLTLLGVTKAVSLDVTFNKQDNNPFIPANYVAGFSAKGTIKRSDFGMDFAVPMIADEVELTIEVEAIRID